jgi:hypothetical protein
MAYSASNPPVCLSARVGSGPALWIYNSADVHTDVDATDYFSNGKRLGMKVGDHVIVGKTTATIGSTLHQVSAISAAGAATVSLAILA